MTRETSFFVPGLARQRVRAEGQESPDERQKHQETTREVDIHTRGQIRAIRMAMLTKKNNNEVRPTVVILSLEHHLPHLHRDISYIQKLKNVHDGIERRLCSTRCSEIVRPARPLLLAFRCMSSTPNITHTNNSTYVSPREHYLLQFPFVEPVSKHKKQTYARGSPRIRRLRLKSAQYQEARHPPCLHTYTPYTHAVLLFVPYS